MIRLNIRYNTMSPDLKAAIAKVADTRPLTKAMGEVTVQTAKGAFNNPTLRAAPWPAKADGTPATLRKRQLLARSPRLDAVTPKRAIVGSDRKYAAIHQLGGRKKKMPQRPYFPILKNKPTKHLVRQWQSALRAKLKIG